jgi:hypothetical protein
VLFKRVAAREFAAVVEADRSATLLIQVLQTLFDFLMPMVGVLGLNLDDDRKPRLAIDEPWLLVLEATARPGLNVQVANRRGLGRRLEHGARLGEEQLHGDRREKLIERLAAM